MQAQEKFLMKKKDSYEEFCRWVALPYDLRKPRTQSEFEKRHDLSQGLTSVWKKREDFVKKVRQFMVDWARDKTPNILDAIYKRAVRRSDRAAKIWLDWEREGVREEQGERVKMTPFVLVGVPQEKIDRLFQPQEEIDEEGIVEVGI